MSPLALPVFSQVGEGQGVRAPPCSFSPSTCPCSSISSGESQRSKTRVFCAYPFGVNELFRKNSAEKQALGNENPQMGWTGEANFSVPIWAN